MKKIYFYFCVFMVLLCSCMIPVSILAACNNYYCILVFFLALFGVACFTIEAGENSNF